MPENKDIATELLICDSRNIKLPINASNWLSFDEQARLARISHQQQAELFLMGRYLLRQLAGRRLGIPGEQLEIRVDHRGKPALVGQPLFFNLSHSGSLLTLALDSHAKLGVDVETRRLSVSQAHRLARRYLHPDEQRWLMAQRHPAHDFIRLWTAKEALVKAQGSGIANTLAGFSWHPGSSHTRLEQQCYQLYQWPLTSAWLSLAVATEQRQIPQLIKLTDLADCLEITGPQPYLAINPL
ncbi:4'-phosphopantetheinyl transferase family protein [Zobellella maritima]|uniref:4'-phosphopantetheinyl transferase family protein n=1 Tax=Zobellella maritima TaxID=2059725 RepID=UPI000E30749A|nr:4'-phosphopantetheinyl transferase superfamily protein [Zobellella maritima]